MQRMAVIGLGRFGMELAKGLADRRAEVVAIDANGRLIEQIRDHVTLAVRLDSTDVEALQAQGIGNVDVAVVGIGEGFEAALLTVLGLKQLGVKRVIARAQNLTQADILEKVGADQIILPELESARHLAHRLVLPQWQDHVELAPNHSLIQLRAPQEFHHKTLVALNLRQRFGVNVVAIKRRRPATDDQPADAVAEEIISVPRPTDTIEPTDVLVLVGPDDALARLPTSPV